MSLWEHYFLRWAGEGKWLIINRGPNLLEIFVLSYILTGIFACYLFRKKTDMGWIRSDLILQETKLQKINIVICHYVTTLLWVFVSLWVMRVMFLMVGSLGVYMGDQVSREYGAGLSRGPFYGLILLFYFVMGFLGSLYMLYAPIGSSDFKMILLERPIIILSSDKPVYKIPWEYRWWLGYVIPFGLLVWTLRPVLKGFFSYGLLFYIPIVLYMWGVWGVGHNVEMRNLVRKILGVAFYGIFIYASIFAIPFIFGFI